jgi:membrane fusion protein (multidrug efflux system)
MIRIIMFMFMGALLLQSSCTHKEEKPEHEVRLTVTSPVRMDTAITQDYVCQIHSIQHIELRAQERGYLQKIFVDEGKYVRKGQRLFQIMPRLYEAELLKAKAEANFAEIEYQSTKRLADSNIVAPNELAMAKAKFDKANAELAMAQVHLDFTTISAPFSGIIDRFHVRLGSLVEEGDMLTSLSDNSKMWVYFNVPEAEYLDYKTRVKRDSSMQVKLLMANNKMFAYPGIVETIEADFNNETGNIPFRATFPNPESLLRHGETGNIQMTIPLKNVLIIPQKATFEVLDKNYVFVVNDDHRVEARRIVIGEEMPHLFVVREGLTEKDHILLDGLRLVKEGQEISYDYQAPDSVISHLNLYAE